MAAIVLASAGSWLGGYVASSLMAGTMISAAGYVAGMAVGRAIGGAIGSAVGGAIDRALFGPKQQPIHGPRLGDLSIQSSLDGAPLPTIWGTVRIAGNVIWSTGLEEIATTTRSGGGGSGGGGGASVTTYSYRTDVAVALCSGPITGIRRIWADGKLIYDVGTDANYSTLTASSSRAASIRIYPGSETQQPDPLIQAVKGAANTPAYRGVAYVVFEDLQLADFGNRLPNFTFEVVRSVTPEALTLLSNAPETINIGEVRAVRRKSGELTKFATLHYIGASGSVGTYLLRWWYVSPSGQWLNKSSSVFHLGQSRWIGSIAYTSSDSYADESVFLYIGGSPDYILAIKADADNGLLFYIAGMQVSNLYRTHVTDSYIYISVPDYLHAVRNDSLVPLSVQSHVSLGYSGPLVTFPSNPGNVVYYTSFNIRVDEQIRSMTVDAKYLYLAIRDLLDYTWDIVRINLNTFFSSRGKVWNYNDLAPDVISNYVSADDTIVIGKRSEGGAVISHWTQYGNGLLEIEQFPNIVTLSSNVPYVMQVYHHSVDPQMIATKLYCINGMNDVMDRWLERVYSYGRLPQGTQQLSSIVANLIETAGLTSARYDVTALASDIVRGYVVAGPTAARGAIEPLQAAYHFDLVEEDGKIVARKRGGSTAATIPDEDIGASEDGNAKPLIVSRTDPLDMPSEISLTYIDRDLDYQPGTQYARRLTAQHRNIAGVSLPIVMTSQEAARLAEVMLNVAWYSGAHEVKSSLTYEYARLSPADVVSMSGYGSGWRVRITQLDLGQPGLLMLSGVPDLQSLYTSVVGGSDAATLTQLLGVSSPTRLVMLDGPLLREADNSPGWYVAMGGYVSGWIGASLYKSNDGGSSYSLVLRATSAQAATIGYATTVLGNADSRVWDNANTVTIRLLDGSLSSATMADVLNGANSALLGMPGRWELIQWRTATLNADGTYTLRDLLRGRLGTDHAAGSHAVFDVFVLLGADWIQNLSLSTSEINAVRHYKAVTAGKALEDVLPEAYTYTGERLRCLSPVLLGGGRNAAGDVIINWVRRGRINGGWNNFSDIPIGEASEQYEVEVWTSGYGTLKRTFTGLTSPTVTYTSAQQITDFGSNQSTVFLRVYQISATTGRGRVLQGSV